MKTISFFPLLFCIIITTNCGNSSASAEAMTNAGNENPDNGIVGEWTRIGIGMDKNNDGKLEDTEVDRNDPSPIGFDYLRFYANGKCLFTSDLIEATYVIKKEPKMTVNTIYIYSDGLPKSLSDKEKDENAYRLRIFSIEPDRLGIKPAHTQGQIALYKRKK